MINTLLHDIVDLSRTEPALFARVSYNVKEKGQNERDRYRKFFAYTGPDVDTIEVVQRNFHSWQAYPLGFWERPRGPDLREYAPEAQIVGFFLQTGLDDA